MIKFLKFLLTLFGIIYVVILFLAAYSAHATELCIQQDYSNPDKAPNWECPGPEESIVLPDIKFMPSVGLKAGSSYIPNTSNDSIILNYDSVIMDINKVLQLGLRIKGLRRLRWIDRHKNAELNEIERNFIKTQMQVKLDLAMTQAKIYKEQRDRANRWYHSWSFGFASGIASVLLIEVVTVIVFSHL